MFRIFPINIKAENPLASDNNIINTTISDEGESFC